MDADDQERQLQEDKLKKAFNEFLISPLLDNISDTAFISSFEDYEGSTDNKIVKMLQYWKECPQSQQGVMMRMFVDMANKETSQHFQSLAYQVLHLIIHNNIVSSKTVCECLVLSDGMQLKHATTWKLTINIINNAINTFDYKGSRDLLHNLLEKVCKIDKCHSRASLDLVTSLVKLIEHLMSREACLLPAYFAVNEIEKLYLEGRPAPHWEIRKALADYTQSFVPTARIHTILGRKDHFPVVGQSSFSSCMWKLSSSNLRFTLHGPLPYHKEMTDPQTALLQYLLQQPYSRDYICTILVLNKQSKVRCPILEEQFVEMIIKGLEDCTDDDAEYEKNEGDMDTSQTNSQTTATNSQTGDSNFFWSHTSGQLIFFILFKFTSFSQIVQSLVKELKRRGLRKGRDHLMWVLLQYISGSIHNDPLKDYTSVVELSDFLYPETTPLPVPDTTKRGCIHKLAATCIWVQLYRKTHNDHVNIRTSYPTPFLAHFEFIHQLTAKPQTYLLDNNNYNMAIISNAYSTNSEHFSQPMVSMIESTYGTAHNTILLPRDIPAYAPTFPIRIETLDSLTVHAKMSLIHSISARLTKFANKDNTSKINLSPAFIETFARLLIYTEIEYLGIKAFIGHLLPLVFKEKCWRMLFTLLQMCRYRLNHILPHFRTQLLCQLQTINQVPHNNYQLHLSIENTAIHLIDGFSNSDFQTQFTRILNDPKYPKFLSSDSEEYNKIFALSLAKSIHITGSDLIVNAWPREILAYLHKLTPLSWPQHTLSNFPHSFNEFFLSNCVSREDKAVLKRNVESEYRKWKSMVGENDLVSHFSSQHSQPLFICVLWKCLLEDNRITPRAYKVLDRLGAKALSNQLRFFVDYVVHEVSLVGANNLMNKYVDCINDLIWKWNVTSLDRFVLTMSLRSFDGKEIKVSLFVTQLLLLRPSEFRNRVADFVADNSSELWRLDDQHHKHMTFHNKYPEMLYFEHSTESSQQLLPVYFSNVCLRFIPVFDILIYRLLEVPQAAKSLDVILEHIGVLYRFHSRPINYLYNTLHYYEKLLRDKTWVKKRLVQVIIDSQKDLKPANWCLSQDYSNYIASSSSSPSSSNSDEGAWTPAVEYYMGRIERLVHAISGRMKCPPLIDWRFNECTNLSSHVLTSTCMEFMALPVSCKAVGVALCDLILNDSHLIERSDYGGWVNAVGLIVVAMPLSCWSVLNDLIYDCVSKDLSMYTNNIKDGSYYMQDDDFQVKIDPFQLFNFDDCFTVWAEKDCSMLLSLCHSVWSHCKIGQLIHMFNFIKDKVKGVIEGEVQFLFICHLVGPFLQRFQLERTRCIMELTIEMYCMLERVDKASKQLLYIDTICDFLYHIKYMFVGDGVKSEVEKIIKTYRPELQKKLKFISYQNKEEPQQNTQQKQQNTQQQNTQQPQQTTQNSQQNTQQPQQQHQNIQQPQQNTQQQRQQQILTQQQQLMQQSRLNNIITSTSFLSNINSQNS